VEGVLDVDVRAAIDEQLYHVEVPAIAGVREGGRAVAELRVDVDAFVQQVLHDGRVALAGGCRQRVGLVAGSRRLPQPGDRAEQHDHRADHDPDHHTPPDLEVEDATE